MLLQELQELNESKKVPKKAPDELVKTINKLEPGKNHIEVDGVKLWLTDESVGKDFAPYIGTINVWQEQGGKVSEVLDPVHGWSASAKYTGDTNVIKGSLIKNALKSAKLSIDRAKVEIHRKNGNHKYMTDEMIASLSVGDEVSIESQGRRGKLIKRKAKIERFVNGKEWILDDSNVSVELSDPETSHGGTWEVINPNYKK